MNNSKLTVELEGNHHCIYKFFALIYIYLFLKWAVFINDDIDWKTQSSLKIFQHSDFIKATITKMTNH